MKITGTFDLTASSTWSQSQTRIVRLEAQTALAAVTVNLPKVEDVLALGGREVEIQVFDLSGNAAVNNITLVADVDDTINGAASLAISTDSQTAIVRLNTENNWSAFGSIK